MDIKILRNKTELNGTCYIELLPGKYDGKCWNDTSIFLDEEVFGLFEPIIERHAKDYNHYAFVEIDKSKWSKIIEDLETLKNLLNSEPPEEELRKRFRFLFNDTEIKFFENLNQNKINTAQLIQELISWIKDSLISNDAISVLGM